ncbi:MAG: amino acid ABC transporter permease [Propioniciclava sp.]
MSENATRVLFDEPGPRGKVMIVVWSVVVAVIVALAVWAALVQFDSHGQLAADRWTFLLNPGIVAFLGEGVRNTVIATGVAALVAYPLGLALALGRMSSRRWISTLCAGWIEFFRAIPMLLVVYAFLLALPRLSPALALPVFWMLVIPMILVSSATTAEVFRAGIKAIDKGQWEAAESLGMTHSTMMRLVILPQAFRIVLPALLTGLVSLLKDSTLGYVVSYPELMQQGRTVTAYYGYMIQTFLAISVIYVVLNYLLTKVATWLQSRSTRKATANPAALAQEPVPAQ